MLEKIIHKTIIRPSYDRIEGVRGENPELLRAADEWSEYITANRRVRNQKIFWTADSMDSITSDCLTCFVPSVDADVVLQMSRAIYSQRVRAACVISAMPLPQTLLKLPTAGKRAEGSPIIVVSNQDLEREHFDHHLEYYELDKIRHEFTTLVSSLIDLAV